jgi:hypothetical protein
MSLGMLCQSPDKRMHRNGRKTGFGMVNHSRPPDDPGRSYGQYPPADASRSHCDLASQPRTPAVC